MNSNQFKFVDAHVHFYDMNHPTLYYAHWQPDQDHPILGSQVKKLADRNYLADDYILDSKPSGVTKSVHVQAAIGSKDPVEETKWLPRGIFSPDSGIYNETLSENSREIIINNLPVNEKIGDWPMTNYSELTKIDPNPGIPSSSHSSFIYPINPNEIKMPRCVSLGPIGVTKNGVVIFNASDARGEDALAREIVDEFGGHPARNNYHYHFIPEHLDTEFLSNGHSRIVGYINDGFPIYGFKGEGGIEMSNNDLDLCHGHNHGKLGYHYHATIEYPYTIGCYKGFPMILKDNQ